MDTREKLDKIAELRSAQNVREMQKQELIDSVLTPEIKAKLAEIEAEFSSGDNLSDTIAVLTDEVKKEVIELGETVKGDYLMAVYAKGRVSWDTKSLDGYAAAHPEVAQFKKTGDPSVSIRTL